MSNQAAPEVKQSAKQISFEAGTKFRINTERSTTNRWSYHPKIGIIVDDLQSKQYEVLEINQYSVKVRASILGQVEAVWCRFETFIFDNH
jgi:polysaccharide deacetylase 2 family uncharacterized protein YibQ